MAKPKRVRYKYRQKSSPFRFKRYFLGLVIVVACLMTACHEPHKSPEVTRAFYYWKSQFNPTGFEKRRLDSLRVQSLYVKFFDVAWDGLQQKPVPAAKLRIADTSWLKQHQVIPTVFITNECLFETDSTAIDALAGNITVLMDKFLQLYHLSNIQEIQLDCNWTSSTKERYFALLRSIKKHYASKTLSATIRLHQVKYRTSSGIPPVDKGLLMCYNMGNLQDSTTRNSIIDDKEFEKYTRGISSYNLPLDIALPLFDWYVILRNNRYAGLLHNLPTKTTTSIKAQGNIFSVLKDTVVDGTVLRKNDILRYENSDSKTVQRVISLLKQRAALKKVTVSLYHVDSLALSKYSYHELENMYSGFH
ncbi:MAG: hypothetical protein QM727_15075 [Niabella sp.]